MVQNYYLYKFKALKGKKNNKNLTPKCNWKEHSHKEKVYISRISTKYHLIGYNNEYSSDMMGHVSFTKNGL